MNFWITEKFVSGEISVVDGKGFFKYLEIT